MQMYTTRPYTHNNTYPIREKDRGEETGVSQKFRRKKKKEKRKKIQSKRSFCSAKISPSPEKYQKFFLMKYRDESREEEEKKDQGIPSCV